MRETLQRTCLTMKKNVKFLNTFSGSVKPGRMNLLTVEKLGHDGSSWCMILHTNFKFVSP